MADGNEDGGAPVIGPLAPDRAVLDFLLSRRSRAAKTLSRDTPDRATLETILSAAARSPDHGKLAPWRFAVAAGSAPMARLAETARRRATAIGLDPAAVDKTASAFSWGGAVVAVISAPVPGHKIPIWEQELSAGAVCLAAVNAALALGWGANWLTGPLAREPGFLAEGLGCGEGEGVAGFIHIGRETVVPSERDRPELAALTAWL